MQKNRTTRVLRSMTIIKYLLSVMLVVWGAWKNTPLYAIAGILELAVIVGVTDLLGRKSRIAGLLWNDIGILILNIQFTVLRFAGSYISVIMLTNVDSIQALRGKWQSYLFAGTIAVAAGILPVICTIGRSTGVRRLRVAVIAAAAAATVDVVMIASGVDSFSPVWSLAMLGSDLYAREKLQAEIAEKMGGSTADSALAEFYKAEIGDFYQKPAVLQDDPNIILIFTEGLSQNIIDDDRDIMPNVRAYEEKSLDFVNYYDHTAATYRGISGQLFSAHQFNNTDGNRLISLQSILKEKGYTTTFLNSEPDNAEFTEYLNALGFDEVRDIDSGRSSLDKEMYDFLYQTVSEQFSDKPQFIAMYTFGTHVSWDSDDQLFGDGSDNLLNRFYNVDYQFGRFMSRMVEEGLTQNTVIVFTADHATYMDDDFRNSFYPDYEREDLFCDRIPMFIWYEGVLPAVLDVNGRNSLGLAPTILDFLDIDEANFFLGNSLFEELETPREILLNTVFDVPDDSNWQVSTFNGEITELSEEERQKLDEIVNAYLSCATLIRE